MLFSLKHIQTRNVKTVTFRRNILSLDEEESGEFRIAIRKKVRELLDYYLPEGNLSIVSFFFDVREKVPDVILSQGENPEKETSICLPKKNIFQELSP